MKLPLYVQQHVAHMHGCRKVSTCEGWPQDARVVGRSTRMVTWSTSKMLAMLPLGDQYGMQAVTAECKAQLLSMQFRPETYSELYAIKWLGLAQELQVRQNY